MQYTTMKQCPLRPGEVCTRNCKWAVLFDNEFKCSAEVIAESLLRLSVDVKDMVVQNG